MRSASSTQSSHAAEDASATEVMPSDVLGDIVERNVSALVSPSVNHPPSTLAAVSAVVGVGFPRVEVGKHYGRRQPREASLHQPPPPSLGDGDRASYAPVGLSAHVQPEDGVPGAENNLPSDAPYRTAFTVNTITPGTTPSADATHSTQTYLTAGGGAAAEVAHQWTPDDFRQLLTGYYTRPLPATSQAWMVSLLASSVPAPGDRGTPADPTTSTTTSSPSAPSQTVTTEGGATGEAFFQLLFQCLRSTVRRHQDVALQVLLLHLASDDAIDLRERCLHGPDCAAFLFFLVSLAASAGHPVLTYRAAHCLIRLLPLELAPTPTTAVQDLRAVEDEGKEAVTIDPNALAPERVSSPLAVAESRVPPLDGLIVEVLGEIGAPLGDLPDMEDTDTDETGGADGDLPFSELSELLRQGEDGRVALEKMRFTTRVLMALPSILAMHGSMSPLTENALTEKVPTHADASVAAARHRDDALVARLLLCGGAGSCAPRTATLLAESHAFRTWVEGVLGDVVLGQRPLGESLAVLLLLYRIAHVPSAATALLQPPQATRNGTATGVDSFYETWCLFFTFVLTSQPSTSGLSSSSSSPSSSKTSLNEEVSIMVSVLLLRELVRHGRRGDALLHDLLDVLMAEGLRVGSAIVLEMWLLGLQEQDHTSLTALKEAALASYQQLTSRLSTSAADQPVTSSRSPGWLPVFARAASSHFLASFLTSPLQRAAALTLLGSAVDTQEQVQQRLLGAQLLTAERLSLAFGRLTAPESARGAAGGHWTGFLALQAAVTYADVRLIAAATATYPGISRPVVLGYAASLVAKFESGCLRLTKGAEARLQNDELATMSELVSLLDTYGPATALNDTRTEAGAHPYQHTAQVAAFFTLHGIALTKHCLDAVPALVCLVTGGTNRGPHTAPPRDLAEAAVGIRAESEEVNGERTVAAAAAAWYAERLAHAVSLPSSAAPSSGCVSLPALVALALHLEEGVLQQVSLSAAVSAASTAVAGAPRSWLLYPLFHGALDVAREDDTQDETAQRLLLAVWAQWLRQILGLHQRLKYVLGADALLCHTALWTLAHRRLVFENHRDGDAVRSSAAGALTDLLAQLASLLLLEANSADAGAVGASALTPAAALVLQASLQATVEAESEEPLSLGAFVALAALASQSPSSAALTMLQTILAAPLVGLNTGDSTGPNAPPCTLSAPVEVLLHDLECWGHGTPSSSVAPPSHAAAPPQRASASAAWTLESLVSLIELAAPLLTTHRHRRGSAQCEGDSLMPFSLKDVRTGDPDTAAHALRQWCVSAVVRGVWQRLYLSPRLARHVPSQGAVSPSAVLSFMEKEVLHECLKNLDWRPLEVWPYVVDSE